MPNSYDAVVIGGGPAGLTAAVTLARARRSVLVVDAGQPRNARAPGVHDFLTRDGCPPAELTSAGRAELVSYGGQFAHQSVVSVRAARATFEVVLNGGDLVSARKLLVASGLVDRLPDIPGLADLWGTDVLYCPYCHGWEVKDQPIGVLATNAESVHQALMFRQWSERITFFLNDTIDPDERERAQLAARGIAVVGAPVVAVRGRAGRLDAVELADGTRMPVGVLALLPAMTANVGFLASSDTDLDLRVVAHPSGFGDQLDTDDGGRTSAPGVYAAGNSADISAHVVNSASAGLRVAMAMNADLVAEDTAAALAAQTSGAGRPEP